MPKFFDNSTYNIIIILISLAPLLHNVCGIFWKGESKSYANERRKFKLSRKQFVTIWSCLSGKLSMLMLFALLAGLQIIINLTYHQEYQQIVNSYTLIIIVEFLLIINYLVTCLLIYQDSERYGRTTLITQFNLIVQLAGFVAFAIIIYKYQENQGFAIKHEDKFCWLLFLLRGIAKLIFVIFIFIVPHDTKLIESILTEYRYKNQDLVDVHDVRQQMIANESHYTFGMPDPNQPPVTNISVSSFNQAQQYNKQTTIYLIEYKYYAQPKKAYRSFREFLTFHNDLVITYPRIKFPEFPQLKQSLSSRDIEERRNLLDNFLKAILQDLHENDMLLSFLNAKGNCPQYKGVNPIPTQQQRVKKINTSQYSIPRSNIPETIWEGEDDEERESLDTDYRKNKKKPRTYVQNKLASDYKRFNSVDNIDIDIQDVSEEKNVSQENFQDESNNYSEEEKHSCE